MPAEKTTESGVIHDIGYRRYDGPRLGRSYIIRSLYAYSLRTAFGIGRGAKAKIFPWIMIGIAGGVAIVAIAVRSISGQPLMSYVDFARNISLPMIMFLAIVAPELISRDLRDGVLPLYFSRPLRRWDYARVKLAALISAILLLLGVPQLVMFIGTAFSRNDGLSGTWDEFKDLLPGLATAGIYAVTLAGLALVIASITGRRAFAAAGIAAVFIITAPMAGTVIGIFGPESTAGQLAFLISPMLLLERFTSWLFPADAEFPVEYGPVYLAGTVTIIVVCVSLLLARYRKVGS